MLDNAKLKELFSRAYNSAVTSEQDEKDVQEYITQVFGDGSVTPDPSLLHQFNNLIVQKADEIFKQKATNLVELLASYQRRNVGDIVQYEIPQKSKVKVVWSANGSGVDLVRIGDAKHKFATPQKFSVGFYYEPQTFVKQGVEGFREVLDKVADAKLELYMQVITELVQAAVANSTIPAANVYTGANLTLADYNKIVATLQRYGGRPTLVADVLLIDHIADQQLTDVRAKELITDDIRQELLTSLAPTRIGRSLAVNLVNPFVDATNTETELPVDEGYMFAGGVNQKPFNIVEYGGLRQFTEQSMDDERVKMKLTQEASIEMIFGEAIGYIKDTSVTL